MNCCFLYYFILPFFFFFGVAVTNRHHCCCYDSVCTGEWKEMSHGNSFCTVFPQLQTFAHFQARECAGSPPPFKDRNGADASVKSDAEQGCTQQVLQTWGEEIAPEGQFVVLGHGSLKKNVLKMRGLTGIWFG